LDNDGALPSQFGRPSHELTSFGKFIIENRIVLNSVLCSRSPFIHLFPNHVHYDVSVVFPTHGICNFYYLEDKNGHLEQNVFDMLGRFLHDAIIISDCMLSSPEDSAWRCWCKEEGWPEDSHKAWELFSHYQDELAKLKSFLPRKMWLEMFEAREKTLDELGNIE